MKLFSTEQVSRWHPDKMADQVSDAIVTACLRQDKRSHVACECLLKGHTCILAGEITTSAKIDYVEVAKAKLKELEPESEYEVIAYITEQSPQINEAVNQDSESQGAGDQGMMFGYATDETTGYLPFGFDLANSIIARIEIDVLQNPLKILKGDAKCQVTVDLDNAGIESVQLILISVCHNPKYSLEEVRKHILDMFSYLGLPETRFLINPSGVWTIGGPVADCGLTGRKIVCDQYGGYIPVGGGAFSGKDPSKVDRSAAYMARELAVKIVDHFRIHKCLIQLAYAIGVAKPVSVEVTTEPKVSQKKLDSFISQFDLTPKGIIRYLGLLEPDKDYSKLAAGCHYRQDRLF